MRICVSIFKYFEFTENVCWCFIIGQSTLTTWFIKIEFNLNRLVFFYYYYFCTRSFISLFMCWIIIYLFVMNWFIYLLIFLVLFNYFFVCSFIIWLFLCLFITYYLFICLSNFIYLCSYLFMYLFIYLFICLFTYMLIYLLFYLCRCAPFKNKLKQEPLYPPLPLPLLAPTRLILRRLWGRPLLRIMINRI